MNGEHFYDNLLTDGLKPQWDFYEQVFNDKPKKERVFDDLDDLDLTWDNNTLEGRILNNIDKLKEGKWYEINDKEKIEIIKSLMRAGLLPDVTFNEDFTMIKRAHTDFILKQR